MIAASDIDPARILATYVGEVTTNESCCTNLGLHLIGWTHNQCLVISPQKYSNIGWFFQRSTGK